MIILWNIYNIDQELQWLLLITKYCHNIYIVFVLLFILHQNNYNKPMYWDESKTLLLILLTVWFEKEKVVDQVVTTTF